MFAERSKPGFAIRIMSATKDNAARLAASYEQSVIDDIELLRLLEESQVNPNLPVNGLTEKWTSKDFFSDLMSPHTVILEAVASRNQNGEPLGFAVIDYAATDTVSCESFRHRLPVPDSQRGEILFCSTEDRAAYENALDNGNAVYVREIVSTHGPRVTVALLQAAQQYVVKGILGLSDCHCFGKCLDAIAFRRTKNAIGNRRIKRMIHPLGFRHVGSVKQTRIVDSSIIASRYPNQFTDGNRVDTASRNDVQLLFGIYLGRTAGFVERMDRDRFCT